MPFLGFRDRMKISPRSLHGQACIVSPPYPQHICDGMVFGIVQWLPSEKVGVVL